MKKAKSDYLGGMSMNDDDQKNRYVPPARRGGDLGVELPSSSSRIGPSGGFARAGSYGSGSNNSSSGYARKNDSYGGERGSGGYNRSSAGPDSGRPNFPSAFGGRPGGPVGARNDGPSDAGRPAVAPGGEFEWLPRNPVIEKHLFGAGVSTGINFSKYDDIPVSATGNNVPSPIGAFEGSDLHALVKDNVKIAGFTVPTPVQKYSVPIITADRDLMACAQTGSGKTGSFLFPILSQIFKHGSPTQCRGYQRSALPQALIMAPTRELAMQIHEEARKFTYRSWAHACVIYGGADPQLQLRELRKGCDLLVATPGRLLDMMKRGQVSLSQCRWLVLDEADRMLDMGFEPQIREVVEAYDLPAQRQTLMFSATFPREIQVLASDFLKDYVFLSVGRVGSTSENIVQSVIHVEEHQKRSCLVDLLRKEAAAGSKALTLVFVETKRNAESLDDFLYNSGFMSTSIHGDRTQAQREEALKAFRNAVCNVLVATAVAARGLDIPNVMHVINYDMPTDIDDYVHRIGRTGRAGNTGRATAFFNEKNRSVASGLIELLREANQEIPSWLNEFGSGGFGNGRPDFSRGRSGGGRGGFGGHDHRFSSNSNDRPAPSRAPPAAPATFNRGSSQPSGGYFNNGSEWNNSAPDVTAQPNSSWGPSDAAWGSTNTSREPARPAPAQESGRFNNQDSARSNTAEKSAGGWAPSNDAWGSSNSNANQSNGGWGGW